MGNIGILTYDREDIKARREVRATNRELEYLELFACWKRAMNLVGVSGGYTMTVRRMNWRALIECGGFHWTNMLSSLNTLVSISSRCFC